jgi:hypothetical protein
VGDAAVDQQRQMKNAFVGYANHISSTAMDINATWPIFQIPQFELHTTPVRIQSGVEYISIQYMIEPKDAEPYLNFVTDHYVESYQEAHMIRYGNLNRLIPIGYTPNFTINHNGSLISDPIVQRPLRAPSWQISPRKSLCIVMVGIVSGTIINSQTIGSIFPFLF